MLRLCTLLAALAAVALAQDALPAAVKSHEEKITADGFDLFQIGDKKILTAENPDAPWLRVNFGDFNAGTYLPDGVSIRITSSLDGYVQHLNRRHIQEWSFSSAYFNGNEVTVELIATPGFQNEEVSATVVPSVSLVSLTVGDIQPAERTLCGPVDTRVKYDGKAAARYMMSSSRCSSWLIDDANNCFLSAAHCGGSAGGTVQFEVPESSSTGQLRNPPPEHQYAIDTTSVQYQAGSTTGNDWKYFGAFPNTETGLTPAERQGVVYRLARNVTVDPQPGMVVELNGYGSASSPIANLNGVQKYSQGPMAGTYNSGSRWYVQYRCDSTGGDSGGVILNKATGEAVAIHTHGGCNSNGSGANLGTYLGASNLQDALKKGCSVRKFD